MTGTMLMGSFTPTTESLTLLNTAFENGVTLFDTAEMYPVPQSAETHGRSERILGEWMQSRPRDHVLISTKVAGPSGRMPWIRDGPKSLNTINIQTALEGSLQRLQTDYVDILYLHWPDRYVPSFGQTEFDPHLSFRYVPFEEQYDTLLQCYREGKIRSIGLSNETPFGLMKFCELAKRDPAWPPIYCLQNAYHLMCRGFDEGLGECCYEERVRLHAYSPLAMGLLTGKYLDGGPPKARFNYYRGKFPENEFRYQSKPNVGPAVQDYASLAVEAGISLTEMALRFVVHHPLVETALMGVTSVEQLQENLAIGDLLPLEDAVLEEIDAIHQKFPNPAP